MKDELFKNTQNKQFEFDQSVASVFDDMIDRSVPFYKENLKLCVNMINNLTKNNSKICDLGCSSANLLLKLYELRKDFDLSGVDNSGAMLDLAKNKTKAFGANIKFYKSNLDDFDFFKNDVFISNYTLQFIRPPKRQILVDKIYEFLNEGGFFIFSEKIIYEDPILAKNMIKIYEDYKQDQGYTKFEIASKRQALENVLVPYSEKENINMLENSGFKNIQTIFKWANFQTFLAFK